MALSSATFLAGLVFLLVVRHPALSSSVPSQGQGVSSSEEVLARNCLELLHQGVTLSGVYTIHPYDSFPEHPVQVLCDMDTMGGGWTVIQRRDDIQPRKDFYLTWMEYALGFGNLSGEFWLGLDHIHALTDQAYNELLFNLHDFEGEERHALYNFFYVYDRSSDYLMEVNGYSGNAGDSFTPHNGNYFSTKDRDLDNIAGYNCAVRYSGAWWYDTCHHCNLNGLYLSGQHESFADGIEWSSWHGYNYSLKKTEMKIRPAYDHEGGLRRGGT